MSIRGRLARIGAALGIVLALGVSLAGCAPQPGSIEVTPDTVVLDVRTAGEFADGHLEGAINIDVQSSTFDTEVSELDPDATYVVYCRTGNRSAAAVGRMADLGFTSLIDAGSRSSASTATGLPIVG